MPEVEVEIGGRKFTVACQAGEEAYLLSAASALDSEASTISDQLGRLSESRILLMAGLMLADKISTYKSKLDEAENHLASAVSEISRLKAELSATFVVDRETEAMKEKMESTLEEIAKAAEALEKRVSSHKNR